MKKEIKAYIYSVNGKIVADKSGSYQVIKFQKGIPTAWRSRSGKRDKYGHLIELIPCIIKLLT